MSPSFEGFGEGRIPIAEFLEVIARINRIGQGRNNIRDDKPPFIVVDGAADFLPLEEGDARFWVLAAVIHGLSWLS